MSAIYVSPDYAAQTWRSVDAIYGRCHLCAKCTIVFFEERLLDVVRADVGTKANQKLSTVQGFSAQCVQEAMTTEIHGFIDDTPQFDDITLMVLVRESRFTHRHL